VAVVLLVLVSSRSALRELTAVSEAPYRRRDWGEPCPAGGSPGTLSEQMPCLAAPRGPDPAYGIGELLSFYARVS